MDTLLHKLKDKINGTLEGFDRIVLKGMIKPLCYVAGMQIFLNRQGVLNKEYKDWVQDGSAAIIRDISEYTKAKTGMEINYLPTYRIRKETEAHKKQIELNIENGLIGTWSCLESCNSYRAVYNAEKGYPQITSNPTRCKHLYMYFDHPKYGFMSIRIQTWAPYEIQIAMNGREWLRRQLDEAGVEYHRDGNKFFHIGDYEKAQQLLDKQLDTMWVETLSGFMPIVFPSMRNLLGENMSYTWTLWQSEWAKDYIFDEPDMLSSYMGQLLRHAFITGTGERILRYMGHPVRGNGQPYQTAKPEVITRLKSFYDGGRIRHWVGKNSLKFYNEQNILRFEFTMNDPAKFKIHRTVEGDDSEEKKFLPMRQGIADIVPRTQICRSRIKNITEQMATLENDMTVGELIAKVTNPVFKNGKRYRGLDVTGKDLSLLKCVADPKNNINAITNRDLQLSLGKTGWSNGLVGRGLSGRISRHLRLLREHGLIKKMPKQHKYLLTAKGRALTTALNECLGAKVSDLANLAA
jgi:hypothetical protein